MNILGLSAFYHDSAAALISDGRIVAAAQEERFSRKRHDPAFPEMSIGYCLKQGSITLNQVAAIVFYDKPLLKFERIIETYLQNAPRGFRSFREAMPVGLKEKLFFKPILRKELSKLSGLKRDRLPPLLFSEHHQSHAASAFYPSPFQRAAVLCMDGVGEWATTSVWRGTGKDLQPIWEIHFPHSLGLLYSAFTFYAGFKVNSGEYKLMGLAPYGEPLYVQKIFDHLIDLKEDGTFQLNMAYFGYTTGWKMINEKFCQLFGGPARRPESLLTAKDFNIAASIQRVLEEVLLRLCRNLHAELGEKKLCLAGGVALNCVANGRILRETPIENVWIQPASGDAGGALGAALAAWHQYFGSPRIRTQKILRHDFSNEPQVQDSDTESTRHPRDDMSGSYLGPQFSSDEIDLTLQELGACYDRVEDADLIPQVVNLLEGGAVIGWFSGRMEFGPRALGNRSILADPRHPQMQSIMNLKIKFRESFRPFAPAVLYEEVSKFYDLDVASPYMLLVASLKAEWRIPSENDLSKKWGLELIQHSCSHLPAVTHVDYSARVQTVHRETNPRFHELLRQFGLKTGIAMLVNTSFNVRGEPIVCSIEDAWRCFMRTQIDYLVVENYILKKLDQPKWSETGSWQREVGLD